jgi:4-hydroxy-3-methylbut-2-enyl diphosphate reductase
VDLMLVIGGRNSANTRHLAEVCQQEGVETHHIETAAELEAQWFDGRERVGVTAGASTPDSAVEAVVRRIQELAQD